MLTPTSAPEHLDLVEELGALPEAYGTKRLFLAARDPEWLYAHWDLTREQQKKYIALSKEGHLLLRVYLGSVSGEVVAETPVHPESRHWFVHVGRGGAKYVAELGYNQRRGKGKWVSIAVSPVVKTPGGTAPAECMVQFATLPQEVPLERLAHAAKTLIGENVPLAYAIEQLRARGYPDLPPAAAFASKELTPEQQRALADVVGMEGKRGVCVGSLEISELVKHKKVSGLASPGAAQMVSAPGRAVSVSSPAGGEEHHKEFWFNVNAELIIYGATEPDAKVTLGGRQIKLRPDGSFSCHFALPDGEYQLKAVATSAHDNEARSADFKFSRTTQYSGHVGVHCQEPGLKTPAPENL